MNQKIDSEMKFSILQCSIYQYEDVYTFKMWFIKIAHFLKFLFSLVMLANFYP